LPLTYDCNLNCEYCYAAKRGSGALPFLIGARAIDFLIGNNLKKGVELIFTGGEPLLEWAKIKKLILYAETTAKEKNTRLETLGLATNGLLLNKKILSFCRKKNVEVAVSADGPANKRKTGKGSNSFFILEKKFSLLLEYVDIVRLKITVHPDYTTQFFEIFENFVKKGFVRIDIQPVRGVRWSAKNRRSFLKGLSECFNLLAEAKINGRKIDMKHWRDFVRENSQEKCCPKVRAEFMVDVDGLIYPCSFFSSISFPERRKYAIGRVDSGADPDLTRNYQNFKICENSAAWPVIKKKCSSCSLSPACFKICLGFDIQKRRFNRAIAQEGWQLFRGIERVYSKFASGN